MPDLLNTTRLQVDFALGLDVDGRERLVIVAKGSFAFPSDEGPATWLEQQVPLLAADSFTGEPGVSATREESDYAPFKPRCDVLLQGSAYAPGGKPAPRVSVGLRVGTLSKSFQVVGPRVWQKSLGRVLPSEPQPFVKQAVSYDVAFGGPGSLSNPVGMGAYPGAPVEHIAGKALPLTEELQVKIESPTRSYRPMALGPLGRNFQERIALAGTYDAQWLDAVFPLLPADFDARYHQAAPVDQQMDSLQGGEPVVLINLTEEGRTAFRLPTLEVPVEFTARREQRTTVRAVMDTLMIEPELRRLQLTWRASLPLQRSLHEVKQVVVGTLPRGFLRAREVGKTYRPSLSQLVEPLEERGGTVK